MELFWIPFFSWCLLAFGGVPINRKDRDQAVKAIDKVASSNLAGDCVAVSPEGTRSTTGNILPFKKGPFYLWEQLKTPIIPLVIIGAYDLYPPGNQIPNTGRVYAKILSPILPTEAKTRNEMSALLRRRMLEAWRDSPADAGNELSWNKWLFYMSTLIGFYVALYAIFKYLPIIECIHYYGLTIFQAIIVFFLASMVMTILVFIHTMYTSFWLDALWSKVFGFRNSKSQVDLQKATNTITNNSNNNNNNNNTSSSNRVRNKST
jgi:hypothetical protein